MDTSGDVEHCNAVKTVGRILSKCPGRRVNRNELRPKRRLTWLPSRLRENAEVARGGTRSRVVAIGMEQKFHEARPHESNVRGSRVCCPCHGTKIYVAIYQLKVAVAS